MGHPFFALAFHAYALGAMAYVAYLVRPWRGLAWAARICTGAGLLLHGAGLLRVVQAQHGFLEGPGQGVAGMTFLLLCIYLGVDLFYRIPVMGAFLTPMALAVWAPGLLWSMDAQTRDALRGPLLPVHISIALLGVAAFAAAAGVGVVYVLMERQVKLKHFGLLFARLPSLQVLDELNRRLVLGGFVALSLTLVTGAFFASGQGAYWVWQPKEIGTVAAWLVFAALVGARLLAGWQGRRAALLTMAGFGLVLLALVSSYGMSVPVGAGP